jgi:hypothetical protein
LRNQFFNFGESVSACIVVECTFLPVVEHDAIVEKAELSVWKVQVVLVFLGEFFPVSDCVVGDVADCTTDESEFAVGNCFVFYEFFDCV